MKFDDLYCIEQAINTQVQLIEPMYWILEDAVHSGKTERAKSMLDTILYIAKYNSKVIAKGLRETYRERLKILVQELKGGKSVKKCEAITLKPPISSRKIPFKLESELQDYLAKCPRTLSAALEDSVKVIGTEVETIDGDYRCDVVAESSSMFYPIELKIAQGTHAVVSQCSKYCYYFYRKLRYDRFRKIQGVVIMNGADAWSINELRREGHWVYIIIPTSDTNITLERIH